MNTKVLYVIKDEDSDLYVTRFNRLDKLSVDTHFFKSRTDAVRYIETRYLPEFKKGFTVLQNDLAWDLLEKMYGKDRWHIDVSLNEFKDAINQFKHLKVKRIDLKYE